MTVYDQIFYPIFGSGLSVAIFLSYLAARKSGWMVPALLLLVGIVTFWASLFIGLDIAYRAWQTIPNPPPEAYADPEPAFAFVLGWIPGTLFCGLVFGLVRLTGYFNSRRGSKSL
jgi:hypothetical protein